MDKIAADLRLLSKLFPKYLYFPKDKLNICKLTYNKIKLFFYHCVDAIVRKIYDVM